MKRILKFITLFSAILAVCIIAYFTFAFYVTGKTKLDLNKLKRQEMSAIACYSNLSEIEHEGNYTLVRFDEIPTHVINAVISIEDKRFYEHSGVDLKGVLRAIKNNVFTNKPRQGGSTITQQLIKNTHLSGEKTLSRKLKEMRLAVELEAKLTKNQILEAYLNTVYFGEGAYGIASASEKFFGKEVKNLSVEEGAVLIACLKAPSYYNPYKNKQNALKRRNLVLDEMFNQGYLSKADCDKAKNTDIILNYESNYENKNTLYDEVLQEALQVLNFQNTSDLNGFKIVTYIDADSDKTLSTVTQYGLGCDVSVIITENTSGKIIGYYSTVGSLKRCPASAAKPWLIYAPAIEENLICPATMILDEKIDFDGYSPSNYNGKYYGYVNVKDCLIKSLNVPSVKICNMLGASKVRSYAQKLNVSYLNDDLSVALGNLSGGMSLKELSDAYSVFANNGKYVKSGYIDKIISPKGKTVYQRNAAYKKVFSDATAFLINDMLIDCAKVGTADRLSDLQFEVCAKTGTNGSDKGNIDAYCIAYTANHTVSVWLGNADGSLMSNSISGGNYPTQIAKDVLQKLYEQKKPKNFTPPDSVKQALINRDLYLNDCKIFLHEGAEKDGVKFWFKSDYKIESMPKQQNLPIIKSYKITCNNYNIEIFCETDKQTYFKVLCDDGHEIYDSKNGSVFIYNAKKKGTYRFSVMPYKENGGEIIFGEIIKLPSVLVEGNKNILDTDWWED